MIEKDSHDQCNAGLVVIARNASWQIVTRIVSRYELVGAMRTAHSVLKLKPDAVCIEIYTNEGPTSTYPGKPLVVLNTDDLVLIHHQIL